MMILKLVEKLEKPGLVLARDRSGAPQGVGLEPCGPSTHMNRQMTAKRTQEGWGWGLGTDDQPARHRMTRGSMGAEQKSAR